ncbi:MAG TPA: STAS domain-containing protein [Acidobacteriaceae bacterium]|jgi:anti-sigma B factor antagonist|nr:STAS domain-containing protein [Acidobacteriaceae bacterium]
MNLQIEERFCGNVFILHCTGHIVLGEELNALESAFARVVREFHRIVLNIAGVTRVDSSGVGLVVRYSANLRKRGGDLRLAAPPPFVTELLDVTMLNTVIDSYATEQEAIVSFLRLPSAPVADDQPGHRVLVVDRSPDLGAFVRAVLGRHGYDVKSASLVSDAKVLLQVHPIDYILVGPGTPQMPSANVLAALKNLAPKATALQLTPEFRTLDAHQAAELLLEMFQEGSE